MAMAERRTQQQRRDDAREAMITAATELLGTRGYGAMTLAEIGRHSGVSGGLVTYHFGSKLNCVQAVVERIRRVTIANMEEGAEGLRGLAAIDNAIDHYLAGHKVHPRGPTIFIAIAEAISATPELKELVVEHTSFFRAFFITRIDEAKADGEIPPATDAATHSILIAGLLRGVALQWLLERETMALDHVIPAAQRMVRAALQATPEPTKRSR